MSRPNPWYNGCGFLGEPVYNPFDILLFIDKGRSFRNYWFETGNPSFLIELLRRRRLFLPDLEGIDASEEILDSFDIERIALIGRAERRQKRQSGVGADSRPGL
jgi:hypothetical protein